MAIIYEGPSRLKRFVEQEYARVSHNYERKNPRIILGIPPCNSLWNLKNAGFSSHKSFCSIANATVLRFQQLSDKLYRRKDKLKATKQYNNIRERMRRIGFGSLREHEHTRACYSPPVDAIILDTEKAALQFVVEGKGTEVSEEERQKVFISDELVHELVHNDNAGSVPGQELIESGKRTELIMNQYFLFRRAAKKGIKAVERWELGKGAKEFLEIYTDFLSQEAEKAEESDKKLLEDFKASFERMKSIKKKMINLGILVVDEALAYNYIKAKDNFTGWLKTDSSEKYRTKGITLYDILGKKIESQGKLATLKKVKKAINFSYENKKDCVDLFL